MAIIGSMVVIVLHERSRVQKIENESIAIFQTQHNINTTHRYVTTLVTYGESVMVWNDEDWVKYKNIREGEQLHFDLHFLNRIKKQFLGIKAISPEITGPYSSDE